MELLVATGNPGKLAEMEELLEGLPVQVQRLIDYENAPQVAEDAGTLRDNAIKKATVTAQVCHVHAVADDSGLFVDALDGRPGVRSARYVEGEPTTEKLCRKLLEEMESVPDEDRAAEFRCFIALSDQEGDVLLTATGHCRGTIAREMRGEGGFGYDPVFYYPPEEKTFAEMRREEKNTVSHRGLALRQFREHFAELLGQG